MLAPSLSSSLESFQALLGHRPPLSLLGSGTPKPRLSLLGAELVGCGLAEDADVAVGRAAGRDACLALCPRGCSTAQFLSSIQPKVPAPSTRTEPPLPASPRQQRMPGRGGWWWRGARNLADHLPLLPGRRYGSVDSAANGRSDAESASESSRRTSRQPSLESRRSLDLSDRWVATSSCAMCRRRVLWSVLAAMVRPTPVSARAASCRRRVPLSPPRTALQRSSVGMLQASLGPVASLLAAAPQLMGAMPQHSGPAHRHSDRLAALLPVPCHASGYGSWGLGDSNATLRFWSPPREHLAGQKPRAVIWDSHDVPRAPLPALARTRPGR